MKKLMILAALAVPLIGIAENVVQPVYKKNVYALRISPNGKYIASKTDTGGVYDVATGEMTTFDNTYIGLGNSIANNGTAVGDGEYGAVIMVNGEASVPESFEAYSYTQFNGITPDATRIVGLVSNPDRNGLFYVPFVADVNAAGEVSEPILLPYPDKDFFNIPPQYVAAVWISEDGKTIAGFVVDNRGWYSYPITFQEGADGNWSYNLPSKDLFNPEHLEIPIDPMYDEPEYPLPQNFMTGALKDAYMEDYRAWVGGYGPQPYAEDYMTASQFQQYKEAVDKYNEWYDNSEEAMREYDKIYERVLATSPTFSGNDLCLSLSGEYLLIHGGVINNLGEMEGKIYEFSCSGGLLREISTPYSNLYPTQMLSDGTIVAALPMMAVPSTYFLMPGSNEFISVQDYLAPEYPELVEWIDENFPMGTGLVSVSDDMSVMAGGLVPDQLAYYPDNADFYYSTYILANLETSGIESFVSPEENGVYKVYDLKGSKVLETTDSSLINGLSKGVYIINGKKIMLK